MPRQPFIYSGHFPGVLGCSCFRQGCRSRSSTSKAVGDPVEPKSEIGKFLFARIDRASSRENNETRFLFVCMSTRCASIFHSPRVVSSGLHGHGQLSGRCRRRISRIAIAAKLDIGGWRPSLRRETSRAPSSSRRAPTYLHPTYIPRTGTNALPSAENAGSTHRCSCSAAAIPGCGSWRHGDGRAGEPSRRSCAWALTHAALIRSIDT